MTGAALCPHPIPKRDLHFDLSGVDLRNWHGRGTITSHFFNVQSQLFPQGERFFINSVRHYRDRITDPVLKEQVAGFIGQEAMHGREHEHYNEALRGIGYPVDWMQRWVAGTLWFARKTMTHLDELAMTVSLEHITAISAEDVLADPRILEGTHPEMVKLWTWHAIEETEHKAVAFDVYRAVAGEGSAAWLRRCVVMLTTSFMMQLSIWMFLLVATARSGDFFRPREWGRFFWALWVSPGVYRRQVPRYFRYFRPRFHPWQSDNYARVLQWQQSQP